MEMELDDEEIELLESKIDKHLHGSDSCDIFKNKVTIKVNKDSIVNMVTFLEDDVILRTEYLNLTLPMPEGRGFLLPAEIIG